jgi:hypothetical protein
VRWGVRVVIAIDGFGWRVKTISQTLRHHAISALTPLTSRAPVLGIQWTTFTVPKPSVTRAVPIRRGFPGLFDYSTFPPRALLGHFRMGGVPLS